MQIHHFYPRTKNIGDHFVQIGIAKMIREVVPGANFKLFDINSRGLDRIEYGLTQSAVSRANQEADLIIIGGSNLYEGALGWRWGVELDVNALANLRVPLFLLGIGTGSAFASPLHQPSARAKLEIKTLNDCATLSGVRDVTTLHWLRQLGVDNATLMGDPATFIFNHPLRNISDPGVILITLPPRRIWTSKRQYWKTLKSGRPMFDALVELARASLAKGEEVVVTCNDPADLPLAHRLFGHSLAHQVLCPQSPEEYFALLAKSRVVISGRLHTAVVAFSMGIPFLLFDVDQRTHGFLETYLIDPAPTSPSLSFSTSLTEQVETVLATSFSHVWQTRIAGRDRMYASAMELLASALKNIG